MPSRWRVPDADALPDIACTRRCRRRSLHLIAAIRRLWRAPWVVPGAPGMEHRIGGLEKEDVTGHGDLRCPEPSADGGPAGQQNRRESPRIFRWPRSRGEEQGELLVVGWGSTYGAIAAAVDELQRAGRPVSHLHLRYLNPFPRNLGEVLSRFFRHVLVPENNLGQLTVLLRPSMRSCRSPSPKLTVGPFLIREIQAKVEEILHRD